MCLHHKAKNSLPLQRHPFDKHPPRMTIKMVFLSVFWLNAFPHKNGISKTLSPRTIVTGLGIDHTKHCRIQFGQCVQTQKKHDKIMTPCTIGAIALPPTGNQQGGHCFYSLMSGKQPHRTHWTGPSCRCPLKPKIAFTP
jgi:hypothetical protein